MKSTGLLLSPLRFKLFHKSQFLHSGPKKMRSHFICLVLLFTNSPSSTVDMVRRSLEATSEKWFIWLLVSSAVVAVGCILEIGETWTDLKRWFRLKKDLPVEEENPKSWLVPIGAIGLLLVIFGVIGEGVFEGLTSNAETALRRHDLQTLAEVMKEAGIAKDSANEAAAASGRAKKSADDAKEKADAVSQEADDLSKRIQHEASLLETMTPRGVLLQSSKQSLTENLIPFAGQRVVVQECGFSMPKDLYSTLDKEQEEKDDAWASISQILGDDAKWSSHPGIFEKGASLRGVTVWVNMSASPNTQKAANALSKELARVLPLQPAPFLAKGGSDLGLPPIDEQAPWTLIARDPERIVVSVGDWSLPWATPEAMKKSIARSKKFAERRNKLAKP